MLLHFDIALGDHAERVGALLLVLHVAIARLELTPARRQLLHVLVERGDARVQVLLEHLGLIAQHLLMRVGQRRELVHLDLELKELLVAAAGHRAQQLVLELGALEQRQHASTTRRQLGMLAERLADLLVRLRPSGEHLDAGGEERVERLDVVADRSLQVIDHRVAELLDRLVNRRLDRRRRYRETIHLYHTL